MPIVLAGFSGSSPLARGKHLAAPDPSRVCRLIPARAGKTAVTAGRTSVPAAHPRSRGENTELRTPRASSSGSSPLARGKRARLAACAAARGLIPARAGKTPTSPRGQPSRAAHPRSRGENFSGIKTAAASAGSSPLARGKRLVSKDILRGFGLIPARAGKTRGRSKTPSRRPAHPRSRGENTGHEGVPLGEAGSSPLARGKRQAHRLRDTDEGLIPARAGKTIASWPNNFFKAAHPRSRGENPEAPGIAAAIWGSSPLARGKRA